MRIECAMEEQYCDMLYMNGRLFHIWQLPLEIYLNDNGVNFAQYSTPHCERGYVAVWELIDGRLYLAAIFPAVRLRGLLPPLDEGMKFMKRLFPRSMMVPAMWYTGNLTIHNGNWCRAVGYGRMENRDLQLHLEHGVIISGGARMSVYSDDDYRYYLSFVDVRKRSKFTPRFL